MSNEQFTDLHLWHLSLFEHRSKHYRRRQFKLRVEKLKARMEKRSVIFDEMAKQRKEYLKTNIGVTDFELIDYEKFCDGFFALFIFRPLFNRTLPPIYRRLDRIENILQRFSSRVRILSFHCHFILFFQKYA